MATTDDGPFLQRSGPLQICPTVLRRAQRGDVQALDELLRELEPYVRRICGPIALEDGADAAQESLVVIFKNLKSLREPQALAGWVRTIATRESLRIARKRPLVVDQQAVADLPDVRVNDVEIGVDVRETLARLSPDHRAVLVMSAFGDMDEATMAARLAVSKGTVKSRLNRARAKFRVEWVK